VAWVKAIISRARVAAETDASRDGQVANSLIPYRVSAATSQQAAARRDLAVRPDELGQGALHRLDDA
jgi:hypothetical protein